MFQLVFITHCKWQISDSIQLLVLSTAVAAFPAVSGEVVPEYVVIVLTSPAALAQCPVLWIYPGIQALLFVMKLYLVVTEMSQKQHTFKSDTPIKNHHIMSTFVTTRGTLCRQSLTDVSSKFFNKNRRCQCRFSVMQVMVI